MKAILKKLMNVQQTLVAPKDKRNNFGNYNYRSAEGILEALKPLLRENECVLTINDEVIAVGNYTYIKASVTITDVESGESYTTSASAREDAVKKGMDASQISGATSSYARKYALNAMFAIDDNKDADTNEYRSQTDNSKKEYEENVKTLVGYVANCKTPRELNGLWDANVWAQKEKDFKLAMCDKVKVFIDDAMSINELTTIYKDSKWAQSNPHFTDLCGERKKQLQA